MKTLPISQPAWLTLCLLLASCAESQTATAAADLVLVNGKVVTVDDEFSVREAIAIRGDRIVAVGSNEDIVAHADTGTVTIDVGGRTVIPGLIDSHIHALGFGLHHTAHVMFSTGERLTVAGMLETIGEYAARKAPGEWVYVRGPYSLDFVAENRLPNRAELDRVAPDNPVFINMQGHVGVVNSAAIELAGIDGSTPDPANGVYMRDPGSGDLTGLMYEFPTFAPFMRNYPGYSLEEWLHAAHYAEDAFNAFGLTTVVDLWTSKTELKLLQGLEKRGELDVRWSTVLRLAPEDYAAKSYDEAEAELLSFFPASPPASDWLDVSGIKIIFDGFAEAADMHDPYLEELLGDDWRGVAFWDRDMLLNVLTACARHNIRAFVHVAGDRSLDTVLGVMQQINEEVPLRGRRWTLEHANTMPTSDNLAVARELELGISTQQAMGWSIGKTFKDFWGRERGGAWAPNRTWLEHLGHPHVKAGSDNRPVNPFIGYWAYLAREDVTGDVAMPDEALPREDVLRMYTSNGAYGIFDEADRGTLEAGKLADLLVLSEDILTVPEERVRDILPVLTIVGGEIKHHRGLDIDTAKGND